MADWIYVDQSNLWIEGKRVSAASQGMASNITDAMTSNVLDQDWRVSFGELYNIITEDNPTSIARAVIYGSSPAEDDPIWEMARTAGFEVVIIPRNASNKEKKIDTSIVTEMMFDALTKASEGDMVILVSGDKDFVPPVEKLGATGKQIDVVFWNHAARELREAADEFRTLDPHLDRLTL